MKAFLDFERLIAPTIVKVVYWIGVAGILLGGLVSFVGILYQQGFLAGLFVLLATAFAFLVWRISCELYIVVFGIYERLGSIRDALASRPAGRI